MTQAPPPKAPPKPAAPGGQPPAAPAGGKGLPSKDSLETVPKNLFTNNKEKMAFNPTPLKPQRTQTAEIPTTSSGMKSPVARTPSAAPRPPGTPTSTSGERPGFLMPGMPTPGSPPQKLDPPPAAPSATGQKPIGRGPASSTANAIQKPPAKPGSGTGTTNPGAKPPTTPGAAATPAPAPRQPPKPQGPITTADKLGYQGKLSLFVGKPGDGNPTVDTEDPTFNFDPTTKKVSVTFKIGSLMIKAACLHLGMPPPERGPRRFVLTATLKPDTVQKHTAKLFDANLEIRLQAMEDTRPVLMDLTLYENFAVAPSN